MVTTVDALAAVDPDQMKLLRTLDASRWQAFRFAELPAALPAAISGARIAVAVAVIGAYIAESQTATSGAYSGLGREINSDLSSLQTSRAYAAAVVLFAFAIACFYTLISIERRLAPWAQPIERRHPLRVLPFVRRTAIPSAARSRRSLIALSACGAKQDTITAAGAKPFTVMLDWFPNADHAPLYSAIAAGDFSAAGLDVETGDPLRKRRTAEAARGRQGRDGDLLRARAAARARRRPETGVDRGARAASADLDHRAAGPRTSRASPTSPARPSAPPASPTRRPS